MLSCRRSLSEDRVGAAIVGGLDASPNRYNWVVSLRIDDGGPSHMCGGRCVDGTHHALVAQAQAQGDGHCCCQAMGTPTEVE